MSSPVVRYRIFVLLLVLLLAGGCAAGRVSPPVPLLATSTDTTIAESQLLDIAIGIFAPVDEPATPGAARLQDLRLAEGHYASWRLAQTLQSSAHWGSIRLNPFLLDRGDLLVTGTILQSDGETLRLRVRAEDSTQRVWLDKEYYQILDSSAYAAALGDTPAFPFQSLFNQLANDLLSYRDTRLVAAALEDIRLVAALNFAVEFAPERYRSYLMPSRSGSMIPQRLPAANDPVFAEIADIRARNALFLDAIQDQYAVFIRQVDEPYRQFLARSQGITHSINAGIRADKEEAKYGSSMVLASGIESRGIDGTRINYSNRRSDSLNTGTNARAYAAALAAAGTSFEMRVRPQTLEFSDHTVDLSGSLEAQFQQWREILAELHALDTAP